MRGDTARRDLIWAASALGVLIGIAHRGGVILDGRARQLVLGGAVRAALRARLAGLVLRLICAVGARLVVIRMHRGCDYPAQSSRKRERCRVFSLAPRG